MFRDREEAAIQLAAVLRDWELTDPLVLAIPRGGVVTGAVLARELGAELDVVLARKLLVRQGQPELALGAVAEGGAIYLNTKLGRSLPELADYLRNEKAWQCVEIGRRARLFRGGRKPARVAGRSVIVTDDGIATGSTMIAALKAIRERNPREIIVAVPVAAPDSLTEVRRYCDETVCLLAPESFWAVGQAYEDFGQVTDEEAVALLRTYAPAAPVGAEQ